MNTILSKLYLNLAKKLVFYVLVLSLLGTIFPTSSVVAQVTEPLILSNITVDRFDESATIRWTTSRSTVAKVEYGLRTGAYTWTLNSNIKGTNHAITIFGLQPETTYYFRLTAEDDFAIVHSFEQSFKTSQDDDNRAPVISKVGVPFVTGTTATIQWETNEPATSEVEYGLATTYGTTARDNARTQIHDITLTRLSRGTTYQFRVASTDKFGNGARWFNLTFRTPTGLENETDPLEIFAITPSSANDSNIGERTAVITWRTNKLSEGSIRYSTSPSVGKTVEASDPRDFFHSVTLVDLTPGTTYYFDIYAKDVLGKTVRTAVLSFTTRTSDRNGSGGVVLGSSNNQTIYTDRPSGRAGGVLANAGLVCNASLLNQTGFWSAYFDHEPGHPDFQTFNNNIGIADENNWYDEEFFVFSQVDDTLYFQLNAFRPLSSGRSHFAVYSRAMIEVPTTGEYSFSLNSDDDSWLFIDGVVVINNGGLHAPTTIANAVELTGGFHMLELFYADRRSAQATLQFEFDDALQMHPIPDGCSIETVLGSSGGVGGPSTGNNNGVVLGSSNEDGVTTPTNTTLPTPPAYVCNPTIGYTKFKALYKTADSPDVWALLETGQKHYITSPESFNLYQCDWRDVKLVSRQFLNQFKNATLVRTPADPTVYHLFDRTNTQWLKINIQSPTIFVSYAENFWGNVARINHLDLASYPQAQLIKLEGNSTIYKIEGITKRPFTSSAGFIALGYDFAEVVTLNQVHIDTYVTGEAIQ